MTNLHDARVEAAAKAMYGRDLARSKEAYPDRPNFWAKDRPAYAEHAALAIAAADAVVTVETIAEVIGKSRTTSIRGDDGYKSVVMESNETIARAVLALIRGGEEQ